MKFTTFQYDNEVETCKTLENEHFYLIAVLCPWCCDPKEGSCYDSRDLSGDAGSPALPLQPHWLSLTRAQEPYLSFGLISHLYPDLASAPALVQLPVTPGATEGPAAAHVSAHNIQGLEGEGRALLVPRFPWIHVLFPSSGQPPSHHLHNAHYPML